MLRDWLNIVLVTISEDYDLLVGGILGCLMATIIVLALLRLAFIGLKSYGEKHNMESSLIVFLQRMLIIAALLLWLILCFLSLQVNPSLLWPTLSVRNILLAGLIIVIARIADKLISARLLQQIESQTYNEIYKDQYGQKNNSNITRVVHYALFLLVFIFILNNFGLNSEFQIHSGGSAITIKITNILWFILVLIIARLLLWLAVNLFLYGWYKREKIDLGKQYAYNQLLSYIVYFFAILIALQQLGINLTLMWAGAAALLVGVGIALQQVISDFFSGLVILFERSVEVGDFLDFGEYRGTVKKIGLRASIIETLERKDVIIPNSHLVNDRVTNWSSTRLMTRFSIAIGVAYGSETELVKKLLLEAADKTDGILKKPTPFVRFSNFGDSSLDFELFFYSDRIRIIEDTKSTLRFEVDDIFRAHNIEIPFPQRTIWMNKPPS